MQFFRKYEIMIVLDEKFNDDELRNWAFNYAKNLKRFNVCGISVISRGKHNFSYPLEYNLKGNYIQLNFSSVPKYVDRFLTHLRMDSKVLRAIMTVKNS